MLDLGVDFRANNDSYFKGWAQVQRLPKTPCHRLSDGILEYWIRPGSPPDHIPMNHKADDSNLELPEAFTSSVQDDPPRHVAALGEKLFSPLHPARQQTRSVAVTAQPRCELLSLSGCQLCLGSSWNRHLDR